MPYLPDLVYRIAQHYGFEIEYIQSPSSSYWRVTADRYYCSFVWTSHDTESQFLSSLENFFMECRKA